MAEGRCIELRAKLVTFSAGLRRKRGTNSDDMVVFHKALLATCKQT